MQEAVLSVVCVSSVGTEAVTLSLTSNLQQLLVDHGTDLKTEQKIFTDPLNKY